MGGTVLSHIWLKKPLYSHVTTSDNYGDTHLVSCSQGLDPGLGGFLQPRSYRMDVKTTLTAVGMKAILYPPHSFMSEKSLKESCVHSYLIFSN
jgi:hypothetical protein